MIEKLRTIIRHMFSRKAMVYRVGTLVIKWGYGLFFAWLWGHTFGGVIMISLMIGTEVIWYGWVELRHGAATCPNCGHAL